MVVVGSMAKCAYARLSWSPSLPNKEMNHQLLSSNLATSIAFFLATRCSEPWNTRQGEGTFFPQLWQFMFCRELALHILQKFMHQMGTVNMALIFAEGGRR
jgi:hypothetical protein